MPEKTTISVIKCDVGSLAGHHTVPKPILDVGERRLSEAQEGGLINSHYTFHAGDDLELLMVHKKGENSPEVHKLAWDVFRDDLLCGATSITRLSLIAGKYVGKDDPVSIVRVQHGLPALGEILMPFMHSYFVEGWMRGSHWGPLMPVSLRDSDLFDDPAWLRLVGGEDDVGSEPRSSISISAIPGPIPRTFPLKAVFKMSCPAPYSLRSAAFLAA